METLWLHPQKATHNTSKYSYEILLFNKNERGFRGRRIITLLLTLVCDLDILYLTTSSLRDHLNYKRPKFNNNEDFEVLRNLAKDKVG